MNLKDLLKFIAREDKRSEKYYGHRLDKEKRVLARTVKLTEELGELASEVLAHYCLQRKQKHKSTKTLMFLCFKAEGRVF